jgi:hypothetical protein
MTTTAREQPDVFAPPSAPAGVPVWKENCLNCDSTLAGPFCAQCGQRAAPPHASLKELGGEAFAEFSGWDGKFASTIKLLMLKPGELTRQFLDGRRARFISPVRLYLSASVIFFLIAMRTPSSQLHITYAAPSSASQSVKRDLAEADTAFAPAVIRPLIRQVARNKTALVANVIEALPNGLFALLPVFAALLLLFYRGRHFAEHLYFAIHVHAFMFVALDVVVILQRIVPSATFSLVLVTASMLWIPIYVHLALRRVYGGSQLSTFAKEVGLSALYTIASLPMIVILAMWVAWRMP